MKNARAYREALSKLPLLDATDEKAKRSLVEQHFMRVAGYAVASRILSKSLKANDLPPAGPRRFDGSGYFYPAGSAGSSTAPRARIRTRRPVRYGTTRPSRGATTGRCQGEDRPQQARRRPGREAWRCGRTFSLLPGKRKPGERASHCELSAFFLAS